MMQSDRQRLLKIIQTGKKLLAYLEEQHVTPEQVAGSFALQWTVTTPLYNIGEHTYQISKELKAAYPEIPWSQVSGMRHRLVHNYEDTNWSIINLVLFEELAAYIQKIENILAETAD